MKVILCLISFSVFCAAHVQAGLLGEIEDILEREAIRAGWKVIDRVFGSLWPMSSFPMHDSIEVGGRTFFTVIVTNSSLRCAASVIAPKWVVTVAHCLLESDPSGSWSTPVPAASLTILSDSHKHSVERVVFPGGRDAFDQKTFKNDLALVKIKETFDGVQLDLPDPSSSFSREKVTEYGLGSLYRAGAPYKAVSATAMTVVSSAQCSRAYAAESGVSFTPTGMVCAGISQVNAGSCSTDSGSPITMDLWDKKVLVGVHSFGKTCKDPAWPSAYTRITAFLPFIQETIKG
jgi:secreted trypsin-like serine protease